MYIMTHEVEDSHKLSLPMLIDHMEVCKRTTD